MARRLLRKLIDVTDAEDLAAIREVLESQRVFVRLPDLTEAKRILMTRYYQMHPENAPAALFARGQQILRERQR